MRLVKYGRYLTGILFFVFQLHSQTTYAGHDDAQIFKLFSSSALNIMGKCSARIWPGYTWSNLNILLVGDESGAKLGVSSKIGAFQLDPNLKVPSASFNSGFVFFNQLGLEWMSLNSKWEDGNKGDAENKAEEFFGIGVQK